jgi:guanylate kinase
MTRDSGLGTRGLARDPAVRRAAASCLSCRRRPAPEKPRLSSVWCRLSPIWPFHAPTSRPSRPGECDGVDYNFITRTRFDEMIAGNEFLEWAEVFGNLYGTSAADAERELARGRDVVLVIDVQGARQVRKRFTDTVAIFVMPPSYAVLEQRLRGRSKDPEAAMQRRLQTARDEVAAFSEYDYVIVNDELEACVDRLRAIVTAERTRLRSARHEADRILQTFSERVESDRSNQSSKRV